MMAVVGLLLGNVGLDMMTSLPRFTFGIDELVDGVNIIPMAMGLFGISEVLSNIDRKVDSPREVLTTRISNLWPSLRDWKDAKWPILRGTGVGFCLGMLPGAGAILSTFISYAIEKRISRHPERFGKGAIEGVAAPESANNAASGRRWFRSFPWVFLRT